MQEGHRVVILLHHFGVLKEKSEVAKRFEACGAIVDEKERTVMLDEMADSVIRFLETYKPQVFLPQCLVEGFLAGAIAGRQGLPWVATIHSDDPESWSAIDDIALFDPSARVVAVAKHI